MLEWLDAAWKTLNQIRSQGRLPHALLMIGADGGGKQVLAVQLAYSLLCEAPLADGQPCGRCSGCGWLQAGTHPDLLRLAPEEKGKAIKVDQIRSLCTELAMTSHAGGHKVAIIEPADAMNTNAANSLLKTLEEPTDNTLLILLTAFPGKLPATIRSRCQQLRLVLPRPPVAQRWLEANGVPVEVANRCLQMAGGAPLKALDLARSDLSQLRQQRLDELWRVAVNKLDPVLLASQWLGKHEAQTLQWWLRWLQDLISWQIGERWPAEPDLVQKLQKLSESVDSKQMYSLADGIARALDTIGSGLNRQLMLEDLLISWAGMAGVGSSGSRAGNR